MNPIRLIADNSHVGELPETTGHLRLLIARDQRRRESKDVDRQLAQVQRVCPLAPGKQFRQEQVEPPTGRIELTVELPVKPQDAAELDALMTREAYLDLLKG